MDNPKRVLIKGEDPDLADLSDPAVRDGTTAQSIRAGLDASLKRLRSKGHQADLLFVTTDDVAAGEIARALRTPYDCIVIGAGLRIPSEDERHVRGRAKCGTQKCPQGPIGVQS